jgi:hypothetical protein
MKELLENIKGSPRTTMHGLAVGALVLGGYETEGHVQAAFLAAAALAGVVLGFFAKDPK